MRLLWAVLLLLLVLMPLEQCGGCKKPFKNLATHVSTCRDFRTWMDGGLGEEMAQGDATEEARQAEERRVAEEQARARAERAREEAERLAQIEVRVPIYTPVRYA